MKCYFCGKQAVASRGGLTYHHGLCRKHFDKGHDWFFEQLDKQAEEEEELNSTHTLLILGGLLFVSYWVLGLVVPELSQEIRVGIALIVVILSANTVVNGIFDLVQKLRAKKKRQNNL